MLVRQWIRHEHSPILHRKRVFQNQGTRPPGVLISYKTETIFGRNHDTKDHGADKH
jgi:hypothetical protein